MHEMWDNPFFISSSVTNSGLLEVKHLHLLLALYYEVQNNEILR